MLDIDFLPERIHRQRRRRKRIVRQANLLALALVALGAWGYLGSRRVAEARGELAMIRRRAESLDVQLQRKVDLQRELSQLMVKQRISRHLGSRVNALDLIHELETLLPRNMMLRTLSLDTVRLKAGNSRHGGPRPVAASGGGGKDPGVKRLHLSLTGVAPDSVAVANFIGQLSASPLFEEVTMGYTRSITYQNRTAREFQATCFVAR